VGRGVAWRRGGWEGELVHVGVRLRIGRLGRGWVVVVK
jgi:hypothetical protein